MGEKTVQKPGEVRNSGGIKSHARREAIFENSGGTLLQGRLKPLWGREPSGTLCLETLEMVSRDFFKLCKRSVKSKICCMYV